MPSVLSSNSSTVDTSNFGTPVANWPTGGCNIDEFFAAQYLIFDITLCGEYGEFNCGPDRARSSQDLCRSCVAGVASVFNETCTGEWSLAMNRRLVLIQYLSVQERVMTMSLVLHLTTTAPTLRFRMLEYLVN